MKNSGKEESQLDATIMVYW